MQYKLAVFQSYFDSFPLFLNIEIQFEQFLYISYGNFIVVNQYVSCQHIVNKTYIFFKNQLRFSHSSMTPTYGPAPSQSPKFVQYNSIQYNSCFYNKYTCKKLTNPLICHLKRESTFFNHHFKIKQNSCSEHVILNQ